MKFSINIRSILIASMVLLTLSASVVAQQEISPDRFEAASAQAEAVAQRGRNVKARVRTTKRSNPTGVQTASMKKASYEQIARK